MSHERRALVAASAALVATVIVLVLGYLESRDREEETRRLAIENCVASNDNKQALVIVLDEAVRVRREVNDPAAEEFFIAYAEIKRKYLQPRTCN